MVLFTIFLAAFLASYGLGFPVHRWLVGLQVLDQPNTRSSHSVPTPRGGGAGIMLVIWAGAAILLMPRNAVAIGTAVSASLGLAVVSFIDDRRSVSWRIRIAVQVTAAVAAVIALWSGGPSERWEIIAIVSPILVFWFTAYANAFNFMDGLNGIAAGQAWLAGVGMGLIALTDGAAGDHPAVVLSLLLGGAAAGFLPHNFPHARMFMGDVGSVPLGFLQAVLAVWIARERGWWLLLPLGALHLNFALDTAITLFRRWWRGELLYQAHRDHFYQRLARAGWSHSSVTGLEAGLQVVVIGFACAATARGQAAAALTLLIVTGVWLGFFVLCEHEFRRKSRQIATATERGRVEQSGASK